MARQRLSEDELCSILNTQLGGDFEIARRAPMSARDGPAPVEAQPDAVSPPLPQMGGSFRAPVSRSPSEASDTGATADARLREIYAEFGDAAASSSTASQSKASDEVAHEQGDEHPPDEAVYFRPKAENAAPDAPPAPLQRVIVSGRTKKIIALPD